MLRLRNHEVALRGLAGFKSRARILTIVLVHPLNVRKWGDRWGCVFEVALERVNIL